MVTKRNDDKKNEKFDKEEGKKGKKLGERKKRGYE
jgi:hypothetical protein